MYPTDRKYSKDHAWVRMEGTDAAIGMTDFSQGQLGEAVAISLPSVGRLLKQGEVFGTVESATAVTDFISPLSGEIVAVNSVLADHPGSVNTTPHDAWIVRLRPSAAAEADALLNSVAYTELVIASLGWRPESPGA